MTIRIIKHEAVPQSGSFEVRYSDGQPSRYFYFEDVPGRRLRSEQMTMEQALEAARALARESVTVKRTGRLVRQQPALSSKSLGPCPRCHSRV